SLKGLLKKQNILYQKIVSTLDICCSRRFDTNHIQLIRDFVAPDPLKGFFMLPRWSKRLLRRPFFTAYYFIGSLRTPRGLRIQASTLPLLPSLPPAEP